MSKLYDICLIGLGPAGIGFLSTLDEGVLKNSICFEQGDTNTTCTCYTKSECSKCDRCSIVSGVGGASRFSCGKISNFPVGSGLLPFWDLQEEALENFLNLQIGCLFVVRSVLHLTPVIIILKEVYDSHGKETVQGRVQAPAGPDDQLHLHPQGDLPAGDHLQRQRCLRQAVLPGSDR